MFISPLSFAADCKVIFNLIKSNQDSDFSFNIKVCEMFLVGICSGMMFNGSHGPANARLCLLVLMYINVYQAQVATQVSCQHR